MSSLKEKYGDDEKTEQATAMMDALGIKTSNMFGLKAHVYAIDLYDLFTDEKRMNKLVRMIKMKAFW